GQQDERPADTLLPHIARRPPVPSGVYSEQIDQIPHGMVEKHAEKNQSPPFIQHKIPCGLLYIFYSPIFSSHTCGASLSDLFCSYHDPVTPAVRFSPFCAVSHPDSPHPSTETDGTESEAGTAPVSRPAYQS